MDVHLREARRDERDRVGRLLAEYLFELDGSTEPYRYLDAYWEEPARRPFLIEVDSDVVGLCLVRRRDGGWAIAEFWVSPERRRAGVGRAAVEAVAERARAEDASYLEAKVRPENGDALSFWLAVGFSAVAAPAVATVTRRAL